MQENNDDFYLTPNQPYDDDPTIPRDDMETYKSYVYKQSDFNKNRRKEILQDNKAENRRNNALLSIAKNDNNAKFEEIREIIIESNKENINNQDKNNDKYLMD